MAKSVSTYMFVYIYHSITLYKNFTYVLSPRRIQYIPAAPFESSLDPLWSCIVAPSASPARDNSSPPAPSAQARRARDLQQRRETQGQVGFFIRGDEFFLIL